MLGALVGFLWWNAPPAKIFMGDTGSLGLGGVIVGLAVMTRTQMLFVVLGGLPRDHHAVGDHPGRVFKMTGKRVFKMAPLQHHFELSGWAETTIVVRFWLISALCVAAGLALFYIEWMPRPLTDVPSLEWTGLAICVAGAGVSGQAAARVLAARGARVTLVDARDDEHAARQDSPCPASPYASATATRCRTARTWSSPPRAGGPTRRCSPPRPRPA